MDAGSISKEVEEIVREFCGNKEKLLPTTRLHHDLRIDGDDAAELLERVAARYGTNFDEMVFSKFFPDDSEALSYRLTSRLGWNSDKKALTIGHLTRVIERGRLFDPMKE